MGKDSSCPPQQGQPYSSLLQVQLQLQGGCPDRSPHWPPGHLTQELR